MLKTLLVPNSQLENHLYPNLYRFKRKLEEFSSRNDIQSFALGDKGVIDVLTDGEHAGQVFVDSGAVFVKNSSVKRYVVSEYDGFYITHEKNNLLKRSQLELHDVLFTTIGKYLGVAAVVNQNLVGANINQNVVRIRISENLVSPQYLAAFLNSKIARYQIDSLFTGNTHPILTYPKIKSLKVFIKSKDVHDIVTENILKAEKLSLDGLAKIDEAKESFREALNIDYKETEDSFSYAVQYSNVNNNDIITPQFYRPLYVKTQKLIQKLHPCEPLGELADFKTGKEVGSANYKLYLEREESDIPFIRTTDILNYEVDRYPDFFIDKDIFRTLNQQLEEGDILFTKDGKIGLTAMITESDKCILGSGILRIVPHKEKVDPYYLFTALSTVEVGLYQAKQRTVIASTLPHLRVDRIADFQIPFVPGYQHIINLTKEGFKLKELSKHLIDQTRKLLEDSFE